jgi:hypothetical protein
MRNKTESATYLWFRGGFSMRQSPEMNKVQQHMEPGSLSAEGFLGEDTRNLADILREDHKTVDDLGLTHSMIAERMAYFSEKGKMGLGKPVLVDALYEVVVEDYRGSISCPFSDDFHAGKRNTTLRHLGKAKEISWTELNIHMIKEHGFYEGKGAAFRLEPLEIAQILEL